MRWRDGETEKTERQKDRTIVRKRNIMIRWKVFGKWHLLTNHDFLQ
jgi:hypothetical protein